MHGHMKKLKLEAADFYEASVFAICLVSSLRLWELRIS